MMSPTNGAGSSVTGSYVVPRDMIGKEEHHVCWNRAFDDALKNAPDAWHGQTISVTHSAFITENPGKVGEYKIDITPGG